MAAKMKDADYLIAGLLYNGHWTAFVSLYFIGAIIVYVLLI